jgi:DNA invertase Pin-like site-specific DNA recombinase
MLGVFAQFETNLRRERQLEGIAKAKAAGVYKGRPASIDAAQVRELKAQGQAPRKSRRPSRSAGRRSVRCWKPDDPRGAFTSWAEEFFSRMCHLGNLP